MEAAWGKREKKEEVVWSGNMAAAQREFTDHWYIARLIGLQMQSYMILFLNLTDG